MATDDVEESAPSYELIAGLAAVLTAGVLTYVAHLLFEAPLFGVTVGVWTAVGIYLLLPYSMRRAEAGPVEAGDGGDGGRQADDGTGALGDLHVGAAGYAVSGSGIVALSLGFVVGPTGTAFGAAVLLAALEYVVLARVLPRTPGA